MVDGKTRFSLSLLICLVTPALLAARGWNEINAPIPTGRHSHAMVLDLFRGKLVLFGGSDGTALLNDTWTYAARNWTQVTTPPGLTARSRHAMAYLAAFGGKLVLFGGIDGTGPRNDVWFWDGTSWTQGAAVPAGLTPRGNHAMVYDSARSMVILFGGWNGTYYNDTWEYNGNQWLQGPVAPGGLTPRDSHAMAYDATRNLTVLFGGFDGSSVLSDTWEYNGSSWVQGGSTPAALGSRMDAVMAADPRTGKLVLFGGSDGSALKNDTWTYDGTWTAGPAAPSGLTARSNAAAAADQQNIVLVGGTDAMTTNGDVWEYSGAEADYLVGSGLGSPNLNQVKTFNAGGVATGVDFLAYAAGQWGTNVASGEIDGTAPDEILTGPGPGAVYGPQARGFQGDGTPMAKVNFFAYGTLRFGVNVASGETDGDGFDEILTGAGPGDVFGPHTRGWNFDGSTISSIARINFFAYGTLKFGVNLAGGDVENDGFDEIVTGAGPGQIFGSQVRGFNIDGGNTTSIGKVNFIAYSSLNGFGVNLASADVDNDSFDEIGTVPGPGPTHPSEFKGFDYDGSAIAALSGFQTTLFPATLYGGRIGLADVGGDAGADLIAAAGRDPSADATVESFSYMGQFLFPFTSSFNAFVGNTYGTNVAGISTLP